MSAAIRRALVIVLDSVGCGKAPDAADYGDEGADTLGHLMARIPDLDLPHLASLGLYQQSITADRNNQICACLISEPLFSSRHVTREMDCSVGGFGNETGDLSLHRAGR